MKLNKKVLNSSLVVLLALGLGGCATNSATTTHKSHEAQSAQVVKQSSHKKAADKATTKANAGEQSLASNSSSSASVAAKQTSSQNGSTAAVASTKSVNASAVAAPAKAAPAAASSSVKENQHVQLGLGDVATWTDAKGVTHHVDSDGMDRYTTKGSSQVQYQDWSGQLPSNAVVSHH
ncbi:hypothetical protein [Limosilactobacillus oris]|uniref:hypothetical protein n=1 Tax=Limosilactobacillus oris TaxID=1632 RepID=UPI00174E8D23|nr:hypothetical protein [Limosilactobacillus oris]